MYERFLREPVPSTIGPGKRFKRLLKKVYLRLPMRPLVRFAYHYGLRLGFLDGRPGLVFCTLLAFYDFLAWANVYEAHLKAQDSGPRSVGAEAHPSVRPSAAPAPEPRSDWAGAPAAASR